jgi:hypothetical protein
MRILKMKILAYIAKGKIITEQQRAEKLRKKKQQIKHMKPGSARAIKEGLLMHKSPMEVMKEEYDRRKYNREKKYDNQCNKKR